MGQSRKNPLSGMSIWQRRLTIALLGLAVALYAARLLLFSRPEYQSEMWRFMLGDVAFLFIQVPLVSFVIDGIIRQREHEETRRKLNMVIGAFFSETGEALLGEIASADSRLAEVREELVPSAEWSASDFERARERFRNHAPKIECECEWLERLHATLSHERSFIIRLLANQTLLEHEDFSDMLWAVTHLGEELAARKHLDSLSSADSAHIDVDAQRAYRLLGVEWLSYLEHLQFAYPFLFSLAVRTNPLDPAARAEIAG